MTITIKPECLKAMLPYISQEQTRYYLNGVYFTKGILVATDGHKLAAMKPEFWLGDSEAFILPVETIKQVLMVKPNTKKMPMFVTFDTEKGTATIHHGTYDDKGGGVMELASFKYKPIDGTFPDWKRLIPDETNYTTPAHAGFNAKYLGVFVSLGDSLKILLNNDPTGPCVIQARNEHWEALGVLMPMRMPMRNETPEQFPSWVKK